MKPSLVLAAAVAALGYASAAKAEDAIKIGEAGSAQDAPLLLDNLPLRESDGLGYEHR